MAQFFKLDIGVIKYKEDKKLIARALLINKPPYAI